MLGIIDKLKDKIAQYVNEKIDLVKLDGILKVANVLSYVLFALVIMFMVLIALLFAGIGAAEYFAILFESRIGGYFATAALFIIILIITIALNKPIARLFASFIIRIMTSQDDDDDDDKKD